jgi:RNA polymerase sigma-70 factor (ECF subfamily)
VIAFRNVVRDRSGTALVRRAQAQKCVDADALRAATIDGLPGYVSVDRGGVLQTTALDVRDGRIAAIYIVRNPDKLRHLAAAFDTRSG